MNKYKIVGLICLFIVVLDQATKWFIRGNLVLFERIPVLPFLDITHIRNKGAAFGILNDLPENVRMPLFILVFVVALAIVLIFLSKTSSADRLLICSLSLVLGGAIGNSIDRFRLGYVTDFIDFHWFGDPKYHWPPFNVADSAITVGVILILFDAFFLKKGR